MNHNMDHDTQTDSELSRTDTGAIVILAAIQGFLLWLITEAAEQKVWIFDSFFCTLGGYAVVLLGPTALQLMLTAENRVRAAAVSVFIGVIFSAAAIYLGWLATVDDTMVAYGAITAGAVALVWAWFVTLAFCQNALYSGSSSPLSIASYARDDYPRLYHFAWRNALTLLLALLFTGISWLLLYFWGALFKVIGVTFFSTLFAKEWFVFTATGFLIGIGIVIGRTQERTVEVSHLIVLSLLKWLLPVLCLILLGFMLSLPFTGFTTLFQSDIWSPVGLLMWGVLLFIVFYNGVYRDGRQEQAYNPAINKLLALTLLAIPILAGLSVFGLWLRVSDYGWTVDRVWAAIIAGLLSLHVAGYAAGLIISRGNIMRGLGTVNVVLAMVTVVVVLLANSPFMNPMKLSANSQMQRLMSNSISGIQFDYEYLRRSLGKPGNEALNALSVITDRDDESTIKEKATAALKIKSWRSRSKPDEDLALRSLMEIRWLPDEGTRSPDFIEHMAGLRLRQWSLDSCIDSPSLCRFVAIDLNNNGNNEYLLVAQQSRCLRLSDAYSNKKGKWNRVGAASSVDRCGTKSEDANLFANIRTAEPQWRDLIIGDVRFDIRPSVEF